MRTIWYGTECQEDKNNDRREIPEKQCEVNVKGQQLTQVKQYKYLGATIEHTGQCKTEVAQRVNQAKIAFWEKSTILRSNISIKQSQNYDVLCVLSGKI